MEEKIKQLEKILKKTENALVAFSGGVDSSYLLYKAKECLGENLLAVTAALEVHTEEEQETACRVAGEIGVEHLVVHPRILDKSEFANNQPSRCYHCKRELFCCFKEIAVRRNLAVVYDGANADDQEDFRPGKRAAEELKVQSPLQEAGLTKKEIRQLSKRAGLSVWDRPASPCLATRFPYGEKITADKLQMVAAAEKSLRFFLQSRGDTGIDLRVRFHDGLARIEVPPEKIPDLIEKKEAISACFRELGFAYITLDLQGFRSGSMNETLPEKSKFRYNNNKNW